MKAMKKKKSGCSTSGSVENVRIYNHKVTKRSIINTISRWENIRRVEEEFCETYIQGQKRQKKKKILKL